MHFQQWKRPEFITLLIGSWRFLPTRNAFAACARRYIEGLDMAESLAHAFAHPTASLRDNGPAGGAEIGTEVVDRRLSLIGGKRRAQKYHPRDRPLPLVPGALHADRAVETVTQPATGAFDDWLAGPIRQGNRRGRGHIRAGTEIGGEIVDDRIHLRRADLRAAQDHVVDLVAPGLRSLPQPREDIKPVALRARGRDDVAARAVGQRVGGALLLGLCERRCAEHAGSEQRRNGERLHSSGHCHTLRVRRLATESGGYHSDDAPRPSRWT